MHSGQLSDSPTQTNRRCAWLVVIATLLACPSTWGQDAPQPSTIIRISDELDSVVANGNSLEIGDPLVLPASLIQPPSPIAPPIVAQPEVPLSPLATEFSRSLFGGGLQSDLTAGQLAVRLRDSVSSVSGSEALGRASSDSGSLLFKSPAAISSGVQRRNPIINEPRVRGSRVGSLAANGSYWIPARIDLDTMLSKIDSRIVQQLTVVPGPYSVFAGPVLQSVQFDLLPTPRYYDGSELHGSTSVDYLVNGEQLYGRQDVWGGGDSGGFRLGYGHRTGNDYTTGRGVGIPSSYNSRDINFSYGRDLSPDSRIEFTYLRLDQTNVELPGQAFDIDYLSTDAYEVDYVLENQVYYDQLTASAWYNRTRLNGSAPSPGKLRQFPIMEVIGFTGTTDVDATSTGYQLAASWLADDDEQLAIGTDLRYVNQELNEITSATGFFPFFAAYTDANSPIPDSDWVNPGLFARYISPQSGGWQTTIGARADVANTAIVDDPAKLAVLGTSRASFADIVGTDIEDRSFGLGAAYISSRLGGDEGWSMTLSAGHAQRAPNLTELYVVQSFMFLLQNGLNTVTGDPRLETEKLYQLDIALAHKGERFNTQVRGFQAWINDYITFENLGVIRAPPFGQVEQINLKYVNTNLATLAGAEVLADYRWSDMLTPFGNLQYVRGQDETRDGNFATRAVRRVGNVVIPSMRDATRERGFFSGVAGADTEPLPQIIPLQSRLGLRIHDWEDNPRWAVEISARLVGPQDRVAVSLLEQRTPGFAVGDIRAYWRPTDYWTITGGVENFTDRNYQEHLDFRPQPPPFGTPVFQPGITGYVGVQRTY